MKFVNKRTMKSCLLLWLLVLGGMGTPATAADLIRDGAAAFKAGDYSSALEAYLKARKAGDVSPTLNYNLGVTYYRLGRYDEARQAFEQLLHEPRFSALAPYNLGLVEQARGNRKQARQWFRMAEANAANKKLKALARKAIAQLGNKPVKTKRAGTKDGFDLSFSARAGFAYDDNVYLTPSSPYIDFARTTTPPITPDIQTGYYVPLRLSAQAAYNLDNGSSVIGKYQFRGDIFINNTLDNADRFTNILKLGYNHAFGSEGRDTLYAGARVRRSDRSNFDRDTGIDKAVGQEDISNRLSYTGMAAEARWSKRTGMLQYTLDGEFESRDYEDFITVSTFDQRYFAIGGDIRVRPTGGTRLILNYHYSQRDYDKRHARDLAGDISALNPLLKYSYHEFGAEVRQRFNSQLIGHIEYTRTNRIDDFAGYNDYGMNEMGAGLLFRHQTGVMIDLTVTYWQREYDNAFAFNNPLFWAKQSDGLKTQLQGKYPLGKYLNLWMEFRYRQDNSTDIRLEYEQLRGMIGVEFSY